MPVEATTGRNQETMSVDPSAPRSRRAILASALGGLGAVVASRLIKPDTASANPGDAVLVDGTHTGAGSTSISSTATGAAIAGSTADGTGLKGSSTDATPTADFSVASNRSGVIGVAGSEGVVDAEGSISKNTDEAGVYGFSNVSANSSGVWGDSWDGTGVSGTGGTGVFAAGYYGVYAFGRAAVTGEGGTTDTGVYGFAGPLAAPLPPAGVGVQATAGSTAQIALNVTGKAKFSRSGRTYVATGQYARKITMAGVTTSSYVIATLQTRRTGVYVHAVVPGTGYFYIYLNKAVTANTYVGYLVIN
jgi:hypothetical protein